MVISFRAGCGFAVRPLVYIPYPRGLGSLTVCNRHERPYATERLEDSGRQKDEKMLRETMHSRSCAAFFCHSAVMRLPAVLLRKVSIVACTKNQEHRITGTTRNTELNLAVLFCFPVTHHVKK